MDIICCCCGEPWDIYHVVHESPEAFERTGALIRRCPCCEGVRPSKLPKEFAERLDAFALVAEQSGDDLDGFAVFIEDFF